MNAPVLGIFGLGTQELLIILAVLLFLFGAKKLPELARGLGRSMREFKKATSEAETELREAIENDPAARKGAPAAGTPSSREPAAPARKE